ncbi:hypothetical protein F503_08516 [Ophiostoma piceae UAMH 11346]|uniref:Uncharacterized protein n=1 Tax=Ophiostoma piceae (strain UAMH 11346) TaxID=1262450 RepID=S3C988_OPHP1|nr:hypothetical protein F503_08516 [Ophiostoma piceae UAMH 11346]
MQKVGNAVCQLRSNTGEEEVEQSWADRWHGLARLERDARYEVFWNEGVTDRDGGARSDAEARIHREHRDREHREHRKHRERSRDAAEILTNISQDQRSSCRCWVRIEARQKAAAVHTRRMHATGDVQRHGAVGTCARIFSVAMTASTGHLENYGTHLEQGPAGKCGVGKDYRNALARAHDVESALSATYSDSSLLADIMCVIEVECADRRDGSSGDAGVHKAQHMRSMQCVIQSRVHAEKLDCKITGYLTYGFATPRSVLMPNITNRYLLIRSYTPQQTYKTKLHT